MPKHTQSDHAPRQIRMSLRKLAHTRAHRLSHQLYRGEVEMGDGTTPLADAEMDTSERMFPNYSNPMRRSGADLS
jgi:hypothetical protein